MCGSVEHPNVVFTDGVLDQPGTIVCVLCLAGAIDLVTGWRWEAMMLHSLAVSDVSMRFHNPSAAVKSTGQPDKRHVYRSKTHQAVAAELAAAKLGLEKVESDR